MARAYNAEPLTALAIEGADLAFRFSITNNWPDHTLSFATCPPPYDVELSDWHGRPVPQSDSYRQRAK